MFKITPVKTAIEKNIKYSQIFDEVNNNLKTIDSTIKKAIDNLQSECYVSPEKHFDIPGMSNAKAQGLIYNMLIREIESAGYEITIMDRTESRAWRISGWDFKFDNQLENSITNVLASRCESVKNNRVKK
jgi:hypothetical protein